MIKKLRNQPYAPKKWSKQEEEKKRGGQPARKADNLTAICEPIV
jgi:hypothetical protein